MRNDPLHAHLGKIMTLTPPSIVLEHCAVGEPGSIPGHSIPFVPILLVCPFLPFKLSCHFKIAADSRVRNQSFGKIDKKMSTNKDIIMANLIYITLKNLALKCISVDSLYLLSPSLTSILEIWTKSFCLHD